MMANDGDIAKDTLFEPERIQARAIDWDRSDRGLSSGRAATGLQSRRRIHGRNRNYASINRNALAPREPSIHGPRASPNDEFKDKTTAPNLMWQTDFTYLKVIGWGWFYLSTILDDYSRYIIGWKLCGTMRAEDVTDTLDIALAASGCDSAKVVHKPRLLSDNGSSYIAGDLAEYLEDKGMKHIRGAPMHPQTQGKIERWHQTLKNRILLENYFLEGKLEAAIAAFIDHYNNHRYHENIGNLTPADVYFGRGETILAERRRIKLETIQNRRLNHQRQAA
jgi:transposase InsO family protein